MAETNPDQPVGNWHYEWREISNPYADFNQTKLYELIANLFSQKGHTHQKSDITDFSHTHSPSDVTGLGTWELRTTAVYGFFYVNTALRLIEFTYDRERYTFTSNTYDDLGVMPSTYFPKEDITLSLKFGQYGHISKDDGHIYVHGTGTSNIRASAMWHY